MLYTELRIHLDRGFKTTDGVKPVSVHASTCEARQYHQRKMVGAEHVALITCSVRSAGSLMSCGGLA